jgi:hypothetical protein
MAALIGAATDAIFDDPVLDEFTTTLEKNSSALVLVGEVRSGLCIQAETVAPPPLRALATRPDVCLDQRQADVSVAVRRL